MARWLAELEKYQYTIEYIAGKNNVKADALSRNRNASPQKIKDQFDDKIFRIEENLLSKIKDEQLRLFNSICTNPIKKWRCQ